MKRFSLALCFGFLAASAFAVNQNQAKGFAADKVYELNNFDSVNVFNGNLNLGLPIGSEYVVNGPLSYRFALSYSGNNWQYFSEIRYRPKPGGGEEEYTVSYAEPVDGSNAGLGWVFSLGRLILPGVESTGCIYQSPDGARHVFGGYLHNIGGNPIIPEDGNVSYTSDGSYLRMQKIFVGATFYRDVEFPNGMVHRFDGTTGALKETRDRFNNTVTIAEGTMADGAPRWTITDGHRTQTVEFKRITPPSAVGFDPATFDVVKTVRLAAFGGTTATYTFNYGDDGNSTSLISREYVTGQAEDVGPTLWVPILKSIDLPDGSRYAFTYDLGDGVHYSTTGPPSASNIAGFSGHVLSMTLPTLGKVEWSYRKYAFPEQFAPDKPSGAIAKSVGVERRLERDALGHVLTKRTYTSQTYTSGTLQIAHTETVTLSTFDGPFNDDGTGGVVASKTVSYFSVAPTNAPEPTRPGDYGAPYTRWPSDPETTVAVPNPDPFDANRFLSTKIYDGANQLLRYTYVGYDCDDSTCTSDALSNRRVRSERVVYVDDGNRYATTDHSDFDGLGHYRRTTFGGTFPGVNARTMTTRYNKPDNDVDPNAYDSGSYDPAAANPAAFFNMPPVNQPWVIGTYTSETTTEGSSTIKSLSCFDRSMNFLKRRRLLQGSAPGGNDVIVQYTPYGDGNVAYEETFGGDKDALNLSPSNLCGATIFNVIRYWAVHDYAFGSLAHSRYREPWSAADLNFYTFNATIDANTGFPNSTRDSALNQTSYTYDNSARLMTVTTPDGLTMTYTYNNATLAGSLFTRPTVLAESNVVAGIGATKSRYEYDALGRLFREKRLMEGDWALRDTEYNGRGLRMSTSVWTRVPAGGPDPNPTHKTLFQDYDPFGRAKTIVAPDGSETTFTFGGVSSTIRSVQVATVGGDSDAVTIGTYDRFGRLEQIQEASAPTGGFVTTFYDYDAAGRLTSATTSAEGIQTRTFTYDGRGFLTQETHPEIVGALHYEYDPRGHVRRKYLGAGNDAFDLELEYDPVERLTLVKERVSGLAIKEWNFNECVVNNSPADCDGRLQFAIRYNRDAALGDVSVQDSYQYHGTAGRVIGRTTTVGTTSNFQGLQVQLDQNWNAFGALSTLTYPRCVAPANCSAQSPARLLSYGYTNGLLTSVGGWATAIRYEPGGVVRAVEHSNGLNEAWVPDPNGMSRPCRISAYWSGLALLQNSNDECGWSEPTTPAWTTGRYQYDAAGNIKQIGGTSYKYDSVSRLREVTPSGGNTESYTYDTFGNRTSQPAGAQPCVFGPNGTIVCTYPSFLSIDADPATNRVKTWTYDAAGNVTGDDAGTFTWDGIGTMRSSIRAGRELRFLYSADDERVALVERVAIPSMAARNKTTFTLRGLDNQLLRTFVDDETGGTQLWSWKEDQIFRGGSLLGNATPAGSQHYALDHLGSPRAITTTSTASPSFQSFSAFGAGGLVGSGSLMFTGHERDAAGVGGGTAGLPDYLHSRYYSSAAGRFLSIDRMLGDPAQPQTGNRYSYTANNPTRYVDPTGEYFFPGYGGERRGIRDICYLCSDGGLSFWEVFRWANSDTLDNVKEHFKENPVVVDPENRPWQTANTMLTIATLVDPIPGDEVVVAGNGAYGIYRAFGSDGVTAIYVGMTKNLPARAAAHFRQKGIQIIGMEGLSGFSYRSARAAEQVLIEHYGLRKAGGSLINKIYSIAARRLHLFAEDLEAARKLLIAKGYL